MIAVRRASVADAEAMSAVLIASIRELCGADHHNDPGTLAIWTRNKTPEAVRAWFGHPGHHLFVAERMGEIAAVGAAGDGREILLNYVAPAHRFQGVSKALLGAMEAALGPGAATLSSSETARRFYRAAGWTETGAVESFANMACYPMRKTLKGAGRDTG